MKMLLLSVFIFASTSFTPFSSILKNAEEENKAILLVFSGSDWCKPCMSLKANVLDKEDFLAYQKNNFLYYVADFPRDRATISDEQLVQNGGLAEKYNLRGAFPYLVLLNSDQEILKQHAGTFNSFKELKEWLEK